MTKLNQIIAIEKGIKSRVYGEITEINKAIQKPDLFSGFSKEYESLHTEGDKLPPERKRVQFIASEVLNNVARLSTELMDVTAKKDWTNCTAKGTASLEDGTVIIKDAPVSYLLFVEKQLSDMHTLVKNMPVLDEAETWHKDANSGLNATEKTQTHRTKKIPKPIVLYPATDKHPAQTQMVAEDVIEGYWNTVKQSGAIANTRKKLILSRIEKLSEAVKQAREAANNHPVAEAVPDVGTAIFDFLLKE